MNPADDPGIPAAAARRGFTVAVLGAESTGKTTLARALAERLCTAGRDAVVVDETLRHFCARHGRTPRADEQAGIADEQSARIAAAARQHCIVIADTTGLQTAVYSDFVFGDTTLYDAGLGAHRRLVDLTLLTALDLPWVADGLQRDGPQVQEPVDTLLRQALRRGGIEHAVIAGRGSRRVESAAAALLRRLGWPATGDVVGSAVPGVSSAFPPPSPPQSVARPGLRWRSLCERCGDADCERHALAALRAGR